MFLKLTGRCSACERLNDGSIQLRVFFVAVRRGRRVVIGAGHKLKTLPAESFHVGLVVEPKSNASTFINSEFGQEAEK